MELTSPSDIDRILCNMKNITSHKHFPAYCILGLAAAALTLTSCENEEDGQEAPANFSQPSAPEISTAPTVAPAPNGNVTPAQVPSMPAAAGQRPLTLDGFMTAPDLSSPGRLIQSDEEGTMPVQLGEDLPYTLN